MLETGFFRKKLETFVSYFHPPRHSFSPTSVKLLVEALNLLTIFFYEEQRCEMVETCIEWPKMRIMEIVAEMKFFRFDGTQTDTR